MSNVLVAVPDDWRTNVSNLLINQNLTVLEASSYETALSVTKSQKLSAIVIDIDWIMSKEGLFTTLKETIDKNIPVLMLVHSRRNYDWFEKAYDPPLHDYAHIPFSLDQVAAFMRRMGLLTE
jgi:DNA-binding NtrC family response regulator